MFNEQKKYFKQKAKAIQYSIWDMQFKISKTRMIREEVRVAYDLTKSKLEVLKNQIKIQKEKPTMEKGDIARLDDEQVRLERDLKRYEDQMKSLDLEINGSRPTNEYPDGVIGLNHQLESLRELLAMVKDYCNKL